MNRDTKIYYQGRKIYPRDSKGQFSSLKTKIAVFFRRTAILAVIATIGYATLYGAYIAGSHLNPLIVEAEKIVDTSTDMYSAKIDGLKNAVADKLMQCESGGKEGLIVFDTNKKASIGAFQFQVSTVQHYYKSLYGKVLSDKEAVLIALDTVQARSLAIDVMFNTKNKAGKDWYNCERKLGLDSQIAIINSIK